MRTVVLMAAAAACALAATHLVYQYLRFSQHVVRLILF
jgi:hypothetical protein